MAGFRTIAANYLNVTKRARVVAILAVPLLLAGGAGDGRAEPAGPCTDPAAGFDPSCLPEATGGHLLRQVCDYQWIDGVCEATGFEGPQYETGEDPSPGQPLALRVGAVHEHSSYSDGDPTAVPRDYFTAGRTGHNTADGGGDTGVVLDFIFSSEHSDNAQIPITTSAACLAPTDMLRCSHVTDNHHHAKWVATLEQARDETEHSATDGYTGFTAVRGFEWTNDYFNHMNVYFSTNFRNVKVDGSYLSMDVMWDWLRRPVAEGGGADGLVTFNHPGGDPHLTPFDGGQPHNEVLAEVPGGGNWNDLAYVPDVDERVAGIEVNGGDDLAWYVKALTNGWHLGPVAAEDEHEREWASSAEGKTLVLTRGRSPRDYYFAFQRHRTVAVRHELVGGAPGSRATFPTIHFYADGDGIQDPDATVLGSTLTSAGPHALHLDASGLPPGARVALVGDSLAAPLALGTAGADGAFTSTTTVTAPAEGEDWYFAVVCAADGTDVCGAGEGYQAVTAPIWLRSP